MKTSGSKLPPHIPPPTFRKLIRFCLMMYRIYITTRFTQPKGVHLKHLQCQYLFSLVTSSNKQIGIHKFINILWLQIHVLLPCCWIRPYYFLHDVDSAVKNREVNNGSFIRMMGQWNSRCVENFGFICSSILLVYTFQCRCLYHYFQVDVLPLMKHGSSGNNISQTTTNWLLIFLQTASTLVSPFPPLTSSRQGFQRDHNSLWLWTMSPGEMMVFVTILISLLLGRPLHHLWPWASSYAGTDNREMLRRTGSLSTKETFL